MIIFLVKITEKNLSQTPLMWGLGFWLLSTGLALSQNLVLNSSFEKIRINDTCFAFSNYFLHFDKFLLGDSSSLQDEPFRKNFGNWHRSGIKPYFNGIYNFRDGYPFGWFDSTKCDHAMSFWSYCCGNEKWEQYRYKKAINTNDHDFFWPAFQTEKYSQISTKLSSPLKKGNIYYLSFNYMHWGAEPKTERVTSATSNNVGISLSHFILPPFFNIKSVISKNLDFGTFDTTLLSSKFIKSDGFFYYNELCNPSDTSVYGKICPVLMPSDNSIYVEGWQSVEDCFIAQDSFSVLIAGNVIPTRKARFKIRNFDINPDEKLNIGDVLYTEQWGYDTSTYFISFMDNIVLMEANIPTLPIKPDLGPDTFMCKNSPPILLRAPNPRKGDIRWQDGSTSETYWVEKPGIYWLDVILGPCKARDSILVRNDEQQLPQTLPRDTAICQGSRFVVDVSVPNGEYRWFDGLNQPSRDLSQVGEYWVEIRQGDCQNRHQIKVRMEKRPPMLDEDSLFFCENTQTSVRLSSSLEGIVWPSGKIGGSFHAKVPSQVIVSYQSPNCLFYDTLVLESNNCSLSIPNIFSPNSDGINDTWMIDGLDRAVWQLSVFNRYGQQVFASDDYKGLWDGGSLPEGVYYYHLSSRQANLEYRGWVVVQR